MFALSAIKSLVGMKKADTQMFWIIIGIILALIVLGAVVFFFFSSWNPLSEFIAKFVKGSTAGVEKI